MDYARISAALAVAGAVLSAPGGIAGVGCVAFAFGRRARCLVLRHPLQHHQRLQHRLAPHADAADVAVALFRMDERAVA